MRRSRLPGEQAEHSLADDKPVELDQDPGSQGEQVWSLLRNVPGPHVTVGAGDLAGSATACAE